MRYRMTRTGIAAVILVGLSLGAYLTTIVGGESTPPNHAQLASFLLPSGTSGDIYTELGGTGSGQPKKVSMEPTGIAITGETVYIADPLHNLVRKYYDPHTTVYAGTGIAGYSGDGGVATSADLDSPEGVALDSSGNVYIADTANNVVRKVSSSGTITTIAGNGSQGYSGDGGSATSAELDQPAGVAVDSSGNVYVADSGNNVIRRITPSGTITTIAGTGVAGFSGDGGPATSAQLNNPLGLAVTSGGNLEVADSGNDVVRQISLSTGDISTVAGEGGVSGYGGDGGLATDATLNFPEGVTSDSSGDLLISDTFNNVVREVSSSTGNISTIAGDGTQGFAGDGGTATSGELNHPIGLTVGATGYLLIADSGNYRIRKVSSGDISTYAGTGWANYAGDGALGTDAMASLPAGVAVNGSGNIAMADSADNVVRELNVSTGDVTTVAGDGVAGFSGDGGLATSAKLSNPSGVAFDAAGDLFISDSGNSRIREVNVSTARISTYAGNGTQGYAGDGGSATSAELCQPGGLSVDSSGDLFIADECNNVIREVSSSGTITTVAGGTGSGDASSVSQVPSGMWVASGALFVADSSHDVVRKIVLSTGAESVVAGKGDPGFSGNGSLATSAMLDDPVSVVTDSTGNLYIDDEGNNEVRVVNHSTGDISAFAGNGTAGYSGDGGSATSAEVRSPSGIGIDSSGDIFIADSGNDVVREVSASSGHISTIAGDGTLGYSGDGGSATSAELDDPVAVALDSSGDLFIADAGNHVVREVSGGTISTYAGDGSYGDTGDGGLATSAELGDPTALYVDGSGNLYIADVDSESVREVAASTTDISTVVGDGTAGFAGDGGAATSAELNLPEGLAMDSAGDLFVADQGNDRIREIASGTISTVAGNGYVSYSGDGASPLDAQLSDPTDVSVDSSGDLFIADSGNNAVREVDSGVIDTIAGDGVGGFSGDGGAATEAKLDNPVAVALDGSAGVFVSDSDNNRVRFVNFTTGDISTMAGNGTGALSGDGGPATDGSLDGATGIAFDGNGNLWIADALNDRLRMVSGGGSL